MACLAIKSVYICSMWKRNLYVQNYKELQSLDYICGSLKKLEITLSQLANRVCPHVIYVLHLQWKHYYFCSTGYALCFILSKRQLQFHGA